MTKEEIVHKVEKWVEENYPHTVYQPHEIAIAKHAFQAGLTTKKEMCDGQAI